MVQGQDRLKNSHDSDDEMTGTGWRLDGQVYTGWPSCFLVLGVLDNVRSPLIEPFWESVTRDQDILKDFFCLCCVTIHVFMIGECSGE